MLKFIILSIFTLIQSATDFNFTKIYSYQYIEIDLDTNDVFYEYEENSNQIKFEIFESKFNKQLYTLYQYKKKTDVKFDAITKKYTNYISVSLYENLEIFEKKGNFFVMTKNAPPTNKNLNYKATIKRYISFMPNNPKYKIDKLNSIKELNILNEYNNIYVDIKVDSVYNYLTIYSQGEDILFSVNGMNECSKRVCNFDIKKQSKNKDIYELRILNLDLKKKITRKKLYYLLYIKPNQPIEYYEKDFIKLFYFENINYLYLLNNSDYYDEYKKINEGSIVYYTYPNNIGSIKMFSDDISLTSTPYFWKDENNKYYYIIYFLPKKQYLNAKLLEFNLQYYKENLMGDISIIAVKPTQIINYPSQYEYSSEKAKYTPSILRVVFDNDFDDNLILKFSSDAQCIEGIIFQNDKFNEPFDCIQKKINSSYKGKSITVIFKNEIKMVTLKELNYITLIQYELKKFSFNQVKEIAFQYDMKSNSKIYINFLNPNSNYKYYVYINKDIKYYPKTKEYLDSQYSGNLINTISFVPSGKYKLKIIIQCKLNECFYNDYITIREGNFIIEENKPTEFNGFKDLSYVVFEFNPKKYLKYKIETNTEFGGYNQSLVYQVGENNINYQECIEKYCLFQFEGMTTIYLKVISYYIQTKKNSEISKLMYILFNEDKYEFEMGKTFLSNYYFISSFTYTFKLTNEEIIKQFNNVQESGFVLRLSKNSFTKYGIKVTYLSDYTIIPITNTSQDYSYDYYYYYINIKTLTNNFRFNVSGSFNFDKPSSISFAYISPTFIINFPINTNINITYTIGIPIYVRLIKNQLNSKNEYIIGVTQNTLFTNGTIIKDDGSDLNEFKEVTQYRLSKDYPNNIYTFKFMNTPKIVFGTINGEFYYNEKREYKSFEINLQKNENKFYIGLYNNKQPSTCSYLDGNEKNLVNIYNMAYNKDLDYLINEMRINNNFLCLDNLVDIIRFNSTYEVKTNLIIFDPSLEKEKLINTNYKFYLPYNKKKLLYFDKNDINYNVFKVLLKEYSKHEISLTYSNNKKYQFIPNNNYTFILQYKKTESENFELKSNYDSMILINVLEGKIYEEIILQKNESSITLVNNSVAFELLYGKNFSTYTITVSNFENSFYYKIYETNETDFGKLIIPQFNKPDKFIEYNNYKTVDLKINNPYFDQKPDNQKYIFVMSYVHNFEKDVYQKFKYNLKLIYNPIINVDYERLNESSINIISQKNFSSNYSIGYGKGENFLMIFSTFSNENLDFDVLLSSQIKPTPFKLNKKYSQMTKDILYKELIYTLSISSPKKITDKYTCVEISFHYGKKKIDNIEKYNQNNLKVTMDSKGNINFDSINGNNITYEIYITNSTSNYKNLFENDCFLLEKKKQIKNNENITEGSILLYEVKENSYKLSDIKGNYLINVVAIDNEYNMRIVYKSFQFNKPKPRVWIIVLSFFICIIVLTTFALIFFRYRKNKRNDYALMNQNSGPFLPNYE